jgi:hypothetical protein
MCHFEREINEQHAIASSFTRNENKIRTDSNIRDVMSITVATVCNTQAFTTEESNMILMFVKLPKDVFPYVSLSHHHPTVIMETRKKLLFN